MLYTVFLLIFYFKDQQIIMVIINNAMTKMYRATNFKIKIEYMKTNKF